jgi:hypothetical protein
VELQEVVSGGDQAPFRAHGGPEPPTSGFGDQDFGLVLGSTKPNQPAVGKSLGKSAEIQTASDQNAAARRPTEGTVVRCRTWTDCRQSTKCPFPSRRRRR